MAVTLADKIKTLRRELFMRRKVYPGRVAAKKMTQAEADREIEVAESILADYVAQQGRGAQPTLFP